MPPTIRDHMSTGQRIAVWRQYRGMTQEVCAGLVGKSLSWWKKVEQGTRRVEKLADLVLIGQVLKVPELTDLTGQLEFSFALDRQRDPELLPAVRDAMTRAAGPTLQGRPASDMPRRIAAARDVFHADTRFVVTLGRELPDLLLSATAAHRAAQGSQRAATARALSELYLLVCQWCRHVSAHDLAMLAVDRAALYAHEVGDPLLIALPAWQRAGALKDDGRAEDAYEVCRVALEALTPRLTGDADRTLAVWGHLQLQTALMAGHCSDEGTAFRHLDQADAAAATLGTYVDPVTTFCREMPGVFGIWVNVALGRSKRAVDASNRVDVMSLPSAPARSLGLLNVARGYATRRDDVATLHLLRQAEAESPETIAHSGHVREIVREMLRRDRKVIGREVHEFARRVGIFT